MRGGAFSWEREAGLRLILSVWFGCVYGAAIFK